MYLKKILLELEETTISNIMCGFISNLFFLCICLFFELMLNYFTFDKLQITGHVTYLFMLYMLVITSFAVSNGNELAIKHMIKKYAKFLVN